MQVAGIVFPQVQPLKRCLLLSFVAILDCLYRLLHVLCYRSPSIAPTARSRLSPRRDRPSPLLSWNQRPKLAYPLTLTSWIDVADSVGRYTHAALPFDGRLDSLIVSTSFAGRKRARHDSNMGVVETLLA